MKQNAYFYFFKEMEKVYIETGTKIESFEEYLRHRYSDECYYYSAYAIMGLTPNDYLLRGFLDLDGYKNYHHGWVEFKFDIKVNTKITKKGKIKITNLDNFLLYRIVKVFYFI